MFPGPHPLNPALFPFQSEWILGECAEDRSLWALWPDGILLAEGGRWDPDPERPQEQEEPAGVALQAAETLWQRQGEKDLPTWLCSFHDYLSTFRETEGRNNYVIKDENSENTAYCPFFLLLFLEASVSHRVSSEEQ